MLSSAFALAVDAPAADARTYDLRIQRRAAEGADGHWKDARLAPAITWPSYDPNRQHVADPGTALQPAVEQQPVPWHRAASLAQASPSPDLNWRRPNARFADRGGAVTWPSVTTADPPAPPPPSPPPPPPGPQPWHYATESIGWPALTRYTSPPSFVEPPKEVAPPPPAPESQGWPSYKIALPPPPPPPKRQVVLPVRASVGWPSAKRSNFTRTPVKYPMRNDRRLGYEDIWSPPRGVQLVSMPNKR